MTSLRPNLLKRIERLPKPTNVASAMQPLFEAISNAIHSTQAKYGETVAHDGRVVATVFTDRKKENVSATVEDNGVGLDQTNWDAFTTTDTDNKIRMGGKGVGRLLWLDCFKEISINSVFQGEVGLKRRSFRFMLTLEDQIMEHEIIDALGETSTSFYAKFKGLRDNGYLERFPGRGNFVFRHVTSHFLPTFIGGSRPHLTVHVGDETREYPRAIDEIVRRREPEIVLQTEECGTLKLTLMECDKIASADLKGSHFVHFIAHDSAVHSQSIDVKLGLKYFGGELDRVFHAMLTGEYLDSNVNQERTAFQFQDAVIEQIINNICAEHID
ncbi:MAG: ATP-binding protein [Rhodospirillales bacterium]|nr:ATP-binding protein [Rhodospirillales bacterium]